MSGQQYAPIALYPRERPGTHCIGGWLGTRAGLDGRKISSPPGFHPGPSTAHSHSLYQLSYLAHFRRQVRMQNVKGVKDCGVLTNAWGSNNYHLRSDYCIQHIWKKKVLASVFEHYKNMLPTFFSFDWYPYGHTAAMCRQTINCKTFTSYVNLFISAKPKTYL